MPNRERIFSISSNNKGLPCPFKPILCQEGYCHGCQIYLDWLKAKGKVRSGYDTENKGFRVQE